MVLAFIADAYLTVLRLSHVSDPVTLSTAHAIRWFTGASNASPCFYSVDYPVGAERNYFILYFITWFFLAEFFLVRGVLRVDWFIKLWIVTVRGITLLADGNLSGDAWHILVFVFLSGVWDVLVGQRLLYVSQIESLEEGLQIFIFLLQLNEKFLGMAPRLSTGARAHMLLHVLPLLAKQFERF